MIGWVTTSSTNPEAVLNPLIAACEAGVIPDRLYHLESEDIEAEMRRVRAVAQTVVDAYGDKELTIESTQISEDPDFERIHSHVKAAMTEIKDQGGEVAVDITPGRKFMTAIAFAAGMRYDADYVYYLFLTERRYGHLYPELPRTAVTLYDFTEVF